MPKIGRFVNSEAKDDFLRAYDVMAAQWPLPSTRSTVETSFGTTAVRTSGTGQGAPILLLPGILGNGQMWLRFIEDLARDHVVYTPDVMGWPGRCEQTAPLRDEADVARWLLEVLDGLGVDRIHLAGNSLGAWPAILTAASYPERMASLTMIEPAPAALVKPPWRVLLKFLVAGMRPTPERFRKLGKWLNPGYELDDDEFAVALATTKFRTGMPWARPLTDEQLDAITAPMLVLFGAETVVNDPEVTAARIRKHIPSADIHVYPGLGHDVMWANPEQAIPRFLDFVDTHDPVRT
ncbi:alpha/beta fold hydrolase [Nocardia sp. CNY236]|uniref:alpha/beta fold hydrolase n=1 Tax=Nocardia sp. CNY236 TaxID=1169152 RepID=UPI00041D5BBD|nr:alpha/beta hydrolase [Nocardia sp. CNY236]